MEDQGGKSNNIHKEGEQTSTSNDVKRLGQQRTSDPLLEYFVEVLSPLTHHQLYSDELWQFVNLQLSFIQRYKTTTLPNEMSRLYHEEFERLVGILALSRHGYLKALHLRIPSLAETKEVIRHQYDCFLECPFSNND